MEVWTTSSYVERRVDASLRSRVCVRTCVRAVRSRSSVHDPYTGNLNPVSYVPKTGFHGSNLVCNKPLAFMKPGVCNKTRDPGFQCGAPDTHLRPCLSYHPPSDGTSSHPPFNFSWRMPAFFVYCVMSSLSFFCSPSSVLYSIRFDSIHVLQICSVLFTPLFDSIRFDSCRS